MPIDVALMIEGQNGLNWDHWQAVAAIAEDEGFAGLYRSDHYTNPNPPQLDSLELWVSLTWLASHSSRIDFGPLVSQVSFRHPSATARMAMAVDDLSGGRLILGLGAGWQVREHDMFGLELLDLKPRFARFEEALTITEQLLKSDQPVDYDGRYYQLQAAQLLPPTRRQDGPPLLVGGNGPKRTLPLAARFADEWNAVFLPPDKFKALSERLDSLLEAQGRPRSAVKRSMMTGCWMTRDEGELTRLLDKRGRSFEDLRARGLILGTPDMIREQVEALGRAGVQRVMLQWLDLADRDGMRQLGREVASHFAD